MVIETLLGLGLALLGVVVLIEVASSGRADPHHGGANFKLVASVLLSIGALALAAAFTARLSHRAWWLGQLPLVCTVAFLLVAALQSSPN